MKKFPEYATFYDKDGNSYGAYEVKRDCERKYFTAVFDTDSPNLVGRVLDYAKIWNNVLWLYVKEKGLTLEYVEPSPPRLKSSRHHRWINVYLIDRYCYSNAEGGCWGNYGTIVEQYKVSRKRLPQEKKYWERWVAQENADRHSDIYSVASDGRYELEITSHPGRNWPEVPYSYS